MLTRFRFHVFLLLVLAALGGWVIYKDLILASPTGYSSQSGMKAAMYWFGFLSFALMSSLLYRLLRRQAWKWMAISYLVSLSIAVLATESLVILGHQQAVREKQLEKLDGDGNAKQHQNAKSILVSHRSSGSLN